MPTEYIFIMIRVRGARDSVFERLGGGETSEEEELDGIDGSSPSPAVRRRNGWSR